MMVHLKEQRMAIRRVGWMVQGRDQVKEVSTGHWMGYLWAVLELETVLARVQIAAKLVVVKAGV